MTKEELKNKISMALKDPILQQGFEIICKENTELQEQIAELKRDKEDLIFVRDQKAKCMCEDKQRLTKAKSIIKQFLNDNPVITKEVLGKLEQFLKEVESIDIREDSTLDGDWVVDEH